MKAKQLAQMCAQRAIFLIRREEHLGDITLSQLGQLKDTMRRIVANYNKI